MPQPGQSLPVGLRNKQSERRLSSQEVGIIISAQGRSIKHPTFPSDGNDARFMFPPFQQQHAVGTPFRRHLSYSQTSYLSSSCQAVMLAFSPEALRPDQRAHWEEDAHAPGAARLAHQAKDPLQPGALHPARSARHAASKEVERAAHTQ